MSELATILPALLGGLDRAGVGVVALQYTKDGIEKLFANESLANSLGYGPLTFKSL